MKFTYRHFFILSFFFVVVVSLSGCALLAIPGQIIGGAFNMIGQMFGIIKKMPMPPPWVFI